MKRLLVLLRGVNVGGKNKLPMAELKEQLEESGYGNVQTYIQSGNLILDSPKIKIDAEMADFIEQKFGFRPKVFTLTLDKLKMHCAENPFPKAENEPKSLHLFFLEKTPKNPDLNKLQELKAESESFELKSDLFYLHAPDGIGRSKLAARAEKLLGVPATARNWKTVSKLLDLARD